MTWQKSPDARRMILAAMAAAGRALTVKEIATRLGKTGPTVRQMLYAMQDDEVVRRVKRVKAGGGWCWMMTGTPLPDAHTSSSHDNRTDQTARFDHRALAHVLGMDTVPPPAPQARYVFGIL